MKNRIKKIFENCKEEKPEAILINYSTIKDYSFFHATGFVGGSFEGSSAAIFPDGNCRAIIPQLEENTAEKENKKYKLGVQIEVYKSRGEQLHFLKKALKGCKKIGLNFSGVSVRTFDVLRGELKAKFTDASVAINDARAVKDEVEIKKIKKAVEIAERGFARVVDGDIIDIGVRENDVAAELIYQMQRIGGRQSFPPIIAFGENAAEPHYATGNKKLKKNEMVLVDWGAKFERYCSDLTRTFVLGKMTEKQQRMLEVVHDAQEVAYDLMQEGVLASEVHRAVGDFINKTEFKGKFVHSTGHTLGLEVHDGKTLGNDKFEMKENMVFTVEPGIYVKGIGGVRIEDDVIVRKKGIEKISRRNLYFEL